MKALVLVLTHVAMLAIGFALGVYTLPILIEPDAPSATVIDSAATTSTFRGTFRRDLADSDALHWGEGEVFVGPKTIALKGELAPGPDYKLYLVPEFVETETDFMRLKDKSVRVGDIKTFTNFVVDVPASIDVTKYTTVLVWCERFSQFITAAQYRK